MQFANYLKPVYIFHLILFLSFSISVNNLIVLSYINLAFYIIAHITIIYLSFYFFNFLLFFIFFLYGIFFDIILLNNIGPHLLVFISFLLIVYFLKTKLISLSQKNILYLVVVLTFMMLILEMILAEIILNYSFVKNQFFKITITNAIIILPIIFIFNKIDKK
tara:strand:+ start:16 stop:504 length:489 start_codon:yes stop_codon:yes gene_type:complete